MSGISLSVCLSINLSIYLDRLVSQCIGWSVHPSVLLSIGLLVHWLVDRSVGWSVSPSVCLSVNSKQNECPSGSKMPSQMAQFLYCVQLYEQMFESNQLFSLSPVSNNLGLRFLQKIETIVVLFLVLEKSTQFLGPFINAKSYLVCIYFYICIYIFYL